MSPLRFAHSVLNSNFGVIDRQSEKTTDALRPDILTIAGASSLEVLVVSWSPGEVRDPTPTWMLRRPELPLSVESLRPQMWVAEIVYFPLETELLRTAREIDCRTLDGSGMAVFQVADAFRLSSGIAPGIETMRNHFESV